MKLYDLEDEGLLKQTLSLHFFRSTLVLPKTMAHKSSKVRLASRCVKHV